MRLFSFLLLLVFALPSYSQKPLFVMYAQEGDYLAASVIDQNTTSRFYVSLVSQSNVERYVVKADGQYAKLSLQEVGKGLSDSGINKKILKLYQKEQFICGRVDNHYWTEVYRHKNSCSFHILETDIQKGTTQISDTIKTACNDDILSSFSTDSSLFIVSRPLAADYFLIYEKRPGEKLKIEKLSITIPNIGKNSTSLLKGSISSLSELFASRPLWIAPANIYLPYFPADLKTKVYYKDQHVYLTTNVTNRLAWVLSADLVKKTYSFKSFAIDTASTETGSIASHLIDTILVTARVTGSSINLKLYGIQSGMLLASKTLTPENIALFKPVIQKSGSIWSESDLDQISFGGFLKKVSSDELNIDGCIRDGKLFLSIGSRYVNGTLTGIGNFLSGYLRVTSKAPPPSYMLNATLNLEGLTPSSRGINTAVYDKLIQHIYKNHYQFGNMNMYYRNGKYFISQYGLMTKRFGLYVFDENIE